MRITKIYKWHTWVSRILFSLWVWSSWPPGGGRTEGDRVSDAALPFPPFPWPSLVSPPSAARWACWSGRAFPAGVLVLAQPSLPALGAVIQNTSLTNMLANTCILTDYRLDYFNTSWNISVMSHHLWGDFIKSHKNFADGQCMCYISIPHEQPRPIIIA